MDVENLFEESLERGEDMSAPGESCEAWTMEYENQESCLPSVYQQGSCVNALPEEPGMSAVDDRLYGQIVLGSREKRLIETSAFLRLKRIQQLGFVSRIWPCATHTRYEHSLGCYHLARLAVHCLQQRTVLDEQSVMAFLLASLLHDIGHSGYAHLLAEIGKPVIARERVGRSIIEQREIASILERD